MHPKQTSWIAAFGAALLLSACTVPTKAPPTAPSITASAAPLPADAPGGVRRGGPAYAWTPQLDTAARQLRGALSGGATVAQTTDQRLWVSLPLDEAFASGRSALRPDASGWLDQVAVAVRGNRRAELQIVAGIEGDARRPAAQTLALDRAASARDWLVARGISAPRMSVGGSRGAVSGGDANRLDILIGERGESAGK